MTSILELVYARYYLDVLRVQYLEQLYQQYVHSFPGAVGFDMVDMLIAGMNLYLPLAEEILQLRQQCGVEAAEISGQLVDDYSAQAKKLAYRLSGLSKVNSDLYRDNQQLRKYNEYLTQINQNYKAYNVIVQQNYATLRDYLDSRQKSGTFEIYELGYKNEQLYKQIIAYASELRKKTELLQQLKQIVGCDDETRLSAAVQQGLDALDLKERMANVDRLCLTQYCTISQLTSALESSIVLADQTAAENSRTLQSILDRCSAASLRVSALALYVDVLGRHVYKCDARYLKYKQRVADALRYVKKLENYRSDDCLRLEQKETLIYQKIPLLERIVIMQKYQIYDSAVKFEHAYLNLIRLEKELVGLSRVDYSALLKIAEKY